MTPSSISPDWLPWGGDAFEQARETQKPILLTVGTAWSLGCAEMNRTTYRDSSVLDLVNRFFVPVWVDADDRPDIGDRYGLGGWPTVAFLTADGQLLGGQTYTEPAPMTDLLARVAAAFEARRDELSAPASAPDAIAPSTARPTLGLPAREPDPALEPWVVAHMQDAYDEAHGGFGRASKRIQSSPLFLALARSRAGDSTLRAIATHTLDAAGWSPLFDQADGGVFRYAARRDWTDPSAEKLLATNAVALQVFLEGWTVLADVRYRDRALEVIRYVRETLLDATAPGFFNGQQADDVYYAASATDRERLQPPPVDHTVYTGPNARMTGAFIRAAEALGDSSLLEFAIDVLERLGGEAYQRGQGVAHRVGGDPGGVVARGLLVDQVMLSEALMDAHDVTDRSVYLDMAQELMLFALRVLWDTRAGVFVDRQVGPEDIGLLRQTITPFSVNCRAAAVLARIGREADRPEFNDRAVDALVSQTASARSHSVEAAAYALAAREVCFSESS